MILIIHTSPHSVIYSAPSLLSQSHSIHCDHLIPMYKCCDVIIITGIMTLATCKQLSFLRKQKFETFRNGLTEAWLVTKFMLRL